MIELDYAPGELTTGERAEDMSDNKENTCILTGKELNALLPQVFTREGKIRKDTRRNMRGLDNIITSLKLAERARSEDKARILGMLEIDIPVGRVTLGDELADHIRASDLFASLATKGWYITSR
jgi:hypothetical protein